MFSEHNGIKLVEKKQKDYLENLEMCGIKQCTSKIVYKPNKKSIGN